HRPEISKHWSTIKHFIKVNPSNAINLFGQKIESNSQQLTWGPNEALSCLIEHANPMLINEQRVLNHYRSMTWEIA
ncbi:16297_t:CDS:1, partial [Entrophospora sp. SA101]